MSQGRSPEESAGLELRFASSATDIYLLSDGRQLRVPKAQIYEATMPASSDVGHPTDLRAPTPRR